MSVRKDPSGRRTVHVEAEIAATPEQVWQAIATGPGLSSWFVPTDVDEREGGRIVFHLGPGMDSAGEVTAWEPPRRFAYEERDWAPQAPPVATECTIEARSGGTCVLRLVHSLFASGEEWNDQLESFEAGWPPFFEVLRLGLRHFAGQRCAGIRVMGPVSGTEAEAWNAVRRPLGLADAAEGHRTAARDARAPHFNGVVQRATPRDIVVKLDEPSAGIGLFTVSTWDGRANVSVSLYLFGDDAKDVAEQQEAAWREWYEQIATPAEA